MNIMNILLYIVEFFIIAILVNLNLGTREQIMMYYNGNLFARFIEKYLCVCVIVFILSSILLIFYYLICKDKKRILKIIIQHIIFIFVTTALLLWIVFYNNGYV